LLRGTAITKSVEVEGEAVKLEREEIGPAA
jgi:hypothetical protein